MIAARFSLGDVVADIKLLRRTAEIIAQITLIDC